GTPDDGRATHPTKVLNRPLSRREVGRSRQIQARSRRLDDRYILRRNREPYLVLPGCARIRRLSVPYANSRSLQVAQPVGKDTRPRCGEVWVALHNRLQGRNSLI